MSPIKLTILAFCTLAWSQLHAAQANAEKATIRPYAPLTTDIIDYIASIGVPSPVRLRANVPLRRLIESQCGTHTNAYQVQLDRFNPGIIYSPSKLDRIVLMPACAFWIRHPSIVKKSSTDDIASILRRELGTGENVTVKCDADTNSPRCDQKLLDIVARENPQLNLEYLNSSKIIIPFSSKQTTFRLRDGLDFDSVKNKADSISGGLLYFERAKAINLIRPVAEIDDKVGNPDCRLARSKHLGWPFDPKLLADRLKINKAAFESVLEKPLTTRTIAILDTGYSKEGGASKLPNAFFDKHPVRDQFRGIGIAGDDIKPFTDDPDRLHGSNVVELALGGRALWAKFPELSSILKLRVVRITAETLQRTIEIPEAHITNGISFASKYADVVNISIASEVGFAGIRSDIDANSVFVVVAAGNEGSSLENEISSYPAMYGGSQSKKILTVGAHDGSGKPAEFSNVGSTYIDILAPGCDLVLEPTDRSLFGTSYAAPSATFTVAMLRAFDVGISEIKDRLTVSANYDLSLGSIVSSSGILNVVKALSVFQDVIELKYPLPESLPEKIKQQLNENRNVLFGEMVADDIWSCGGKHFYPPDVVKISSLSDKEMRILFYNQDRKLVTTNCQPKDKELRFRTPTGEIAVPWNQLHDYVRRIYSAKTN